jgi:pyrroline-5-carboxylate reductase
LASLALQTTSIFWLNSPIKTLNGFSATVEPFCDEAAQAAKHGTIDLVKLGFVGTGAITSAIVTGLSSGVAEQCSIRLSPRNPGIASDLANRFPKVSIASSNQDVLDDSEIVLLAIRPQIAPNVISELHFRPGHRVISVVSGLSLRRVSDLVTPAAKITRAVPLPSVANRRGPTAIYPPDGIVADLFSTLGTAFEVEHEDEFDALCTATATIASYFAFAGRVASWLVGQGVPPCKARDYIARIFCGLGNTAVDSPERSFQSLADDHATPGGINEQVLTHLVRHGVFEAVSDGLDAVMHRIMSASQTS